MCEYCEKNNTILRSGDISITLDMNDNTLNLFNDYVLHDCEDINYCPICGRSLNNTRQEKEYFIAQDDEWLNPIAHFVATDIDDALSRLKEVVTDCNTYKLYEIKKLYRAKAQIEIEPM